MTPAPDQDMSKADKIVTQGTPVPTDARHFLSLLDFSAEELRAVLRLARRGKKERLSVNPLAGCVLAMIFQKASTRTRLSFECAILQLGGHGVFMSGSDTQLARQESMADTARVISRMVDVVAIRAASHADVQEMADHSKIPVINALSDRYHPCQLLADLMTYQEQRGPIKGRQVTWCGDINNMCRTYAQAAVRFDFRLRIAAPSGYRPSDEERAVDFPDTHVSFYTDPKEAADGADLLVTDVWISMGQEAGERRKHFAPYRVSQDIMSVAAADALFTHCLPAHRGEEVDADVLDGPHSIAWDSAGNRLHAQKALLLCLLRDGFQLGTQIAHEAEDMADAEPGRRKTASI